MPSGSWNEAVPCHRELAVTQEYFKGLIQTSGIFPSSKKAAGFEAVSTEEFELLPQTNPEWFGVEKTLNPIQFHPCHRQGHLPQTRMLKIRLWREQRIIRNKKLGKSSEPCRVYLIGSTKTN